MLELTVPTAAEQIPAEEDVVTPTTTPFMDAGVTQTTEMSFEILESRERPADVPPTLPCQLLHITKSLEKC